MSKLPLPLLVTAAVFATSLGGTAHALTSSLPPLLGDPPNSDEPICCFFEEGPTNPGKWGDPERGTGASVTYSFMGEGLSTLGGALSVALSDFMPAGYKSEMVAAFDAWSAAANISFMEVPDPDVDWRTEEAFASDIRIAGVDIDGPRRTLARSFFPPNNGGAAAGDIHLDTAEDWKIGFGGDGFDVFQVFAHELGHSIGLGHQCPSVCTALMNPYYTEAFRGLLPDDIEGASSIYGARLVAPVPLPAALPLMAGALALLGALGLRRRGSRISA